MKKYITFGLMISLVGGACFAQHPRIAQLISEKQAKMKKLEKCQGTTKNLKIAGISTLGITAVGIGVNIAEAVVRNDANEDVAKAKKARDEQQTIKEKRECEQNSTTIWQNGECKDKPVIAEQKHIITNDGSYVEGAAIAWIDYYIKEHKLNLDSKSCSKTSRNEITCNNYVFQFKEILSQEEYCKQTPDGIGCKSLSCEYTGQDCEDYVGDVYVCVKSGGECKAVNGMNICGDTRLIKSIPVTDDKVYDWSKRAEDVCNKTNQKAGNQGKSKKAQEGNGEQETTCNNDQILINGKCKDKVVDQIVKFSQLKTEIAGKIKNDYECEGNTDPEWVSGFTWKTTCEGKPYEVTFKGVNCEIQGREFKDGECIKNADLPKNECEQYGTMQNGICVWAETIKIGKEDIKGHIYDTLKYDHGFSELYLENKSATAYTFSGKTPEKNVKLTLKVNIKCKDVKQVVDPASDMCVSANKAKPAKTAPKADAGNFVEKLCKGNNGKFEKEAFTCTLKADDLKYNKIFNQLKDNNFRCIEGEMTACNDGKYLVYVEHVCDNEYLEIKNNRCLPKEGSHDVNVFSTTRDSKYGATYRISTWLMANIADEKSNYKCTVIDAHPILGDDIVECVHNNNSNIKFKFRFQNISDVDKDDTL